jgi:threonine/homoserine/homoserine lactone efflux protein
LVASDPVFRAVRSAGGALYLAYLGLQALRAAARRGCERAGVANRTAARSLATVALREGLISNLTNPKMIAFFPALLPQFVPQGVGPSLLSCFSASCCRR